MSKAHDAEKEQQITAQLEDWRTQMQWRKAAGGTLAVASHNVTMSEEEIPKKSLQKMTFF